MPVDAPDRINAPFVENDRGDNHGLVLAGPRPKPECPCCPPTLPIVNPAEETGPVCRCDPPGSCGNCGVFDITQIASGGSRPRAVTNQEVVEELGVLVQDLIDDGLWEHLATAASALHLAAITAHQESVAKDRRQATIDQYGTDLARWC